MRTRISLRRRRLLQTAIATAGCWGLAPKASGQPAPGIAKVKPSIVAVGTFQRTRVPQFRFLGTGFAVSDGTLVATNAHVLPQTLEVGADAEQLVVVVPGSDPDGARVRNTQRIAVDSDHDIALLRLEGMPLPATKLRDSSTVAEGDSLYFTGFPIGAVLGVFPATHRAMIAAISPVAIPSASIQQLDPKAIRRLRANVFQVFQLDATAFPGNSGSPLYDPVEGQVVGIINMVFVKGTKEAALSQPSGISYAIPSIHLIELLAKVR